MALEVVKTRDDLQEFFEFLFAGQIGYVYSPTKSGDEFRQHFFQWPNQKAELYAHIVSNTVNVDVFIAPALFHEAGSALKENVKGTNVFWAEFDGILPDDSAMQGLPAPTVRIISSNAGHEHWYWKLDEFVTSVQIIEQVNRGLTYRLGADTSGWDADQVLRPPKTINHKNERPVLLAHESTIISSVDKFSDLPIPPKLATSFDQESLLDTAWVIARYRWNKSDFDFFRSREIPVGERSTAMMRLGYICAETGMVDQEIFSILYSADERWGKFRGRHDRIQRLNDIVSKVRLKYPVSDDRIDLDNLPVFGFNSFLQTDIEVEWHIPGLLQKSGSMLLTSKPGLGKTQLSLRFAMALALGKPYLHYEIEQPARVVFFSLEMGHADLKYFLNSMAKNLTVENLALLEENLLIVPLGESLYLDTDKGQKAVENVLNNYKPQGYFFDSLGSTTGETLSDEKTVKAILDWDARVRQSFEVFSWFIHHNRKATVQNKKPKTMDDIYGNTYISARATSAYVMWRSKEDSFADIEIINVKKRLAPLEKPYLITRVADTLDFQERSVLVQDQPVSDSPYAYTAEITETVDDDPPDDPTPEPFKPGMGF